MLHDHRMTRHAEARIRQRGIRNADLSFVLSAASQIAPDAFLLTDQDAAREIAQRKREIQIIERLKGCKVVVADGTIITSYHARRGNLALSKRRRA